MSDTLGITGVNGLVHGDPVGLRRLTEAVQAHGDLRLAADQACVSRRDAEALVLYDGDDAAVTEASLVLYAAMRCGRENQDAYAKRIVLDHLAMRGIVSEAVAAQPWHTRDYFFKERRKDPDFDAAWQEALAAAAGRAHAEAWRRGVDGINKPIVWQGEITKQLDPKTGEMVPVTVKEYSDTMLAMLLKRHDPGFRDSLSVDQRTTVAIDGADMANALASLSEVELTVLMKLTRAPGEPPAEGAGEGGDG